ncbi:major tail protein [Mycobacterium phage Phayonce]|uniref:Major tail protein n=1 Tax=Mycobacterium phage Phayonce TaxID=1647302 RepID=A0A0F6WDV1_9CAUD|nr:major tail protein [Mycobacterium phage Phayonce]AKF14373.1 major tail protein [Mycobacterium phage Phayonce]
MTQPATGDVWSNLFGYNTGNLRKALYGSLLIRDHDGVNTTLAFVEENGVWQSGFTPLTADGKFRTDLKKELGGTWFDMGAGTSDGPSFANTINVQKDHIWQTRSVVRSDITSEEGTIQFGLAEQSPLTDTLEFDLPLASTPAQGIPNYARKKPREMEGRLRQILAIGVDKGDNVFVDVFPAISFEDIDDRTWSPEDLIATVLTWGVSIDPHSGYSHARFRAGRGWETNPGAPMFSAAPVATAQAGGAVQLKFPAATGPASPFTYTATKTEEETGEITDLTLTGSPSVTDGVVTLTGSGLAESDEYTCQVHAENTAGGVAISAPSNAVTGLGA